MEEPPLFCQQQDSSIFLQLFLTESLYLHKALIFSWNVQVA